MIFLKEVGEGVEEVEAPIDPVGVGVLGRLGVIEGVGEAVGVVGVGVLLVEGVGGREAPKGVGVGEGDKVLLSVSELDGVGVREPLPVSVALEVGEGEGVDDAEEPRV